MFWSLSFQLMPGEAILEDSTGRPVAGMRPAYSVFLTNKRAIFRFDGLGSSMAQSFLYDEVTDASTITRMFITYLQVKTGSREHLIHTAEPEFWAARLREMKKTVGTGALHEPAASDHRVTRVQREELHRMLAVLRRHNILTEAEFAEKSKLLDRHMP